MEFANKTFFKAQKIHALITVELFYRNLRHTSFKVNDKFILQGTIYGWILTDALGKVMLLNNFSMCHILLEILMN